QVIVDADKRQIFQYDYAFGPDATQEEVYEKSVTNLLGKFLEGYNVTILAYGQTSSGKTYTMGTADNDFIPPESKGMIPRTINTLFEKIEAEQCKTSKFSVKVSFIEIHNEDLIDLLGEGEEYERPPVTIREDVKGNIYWTGLQELKANSSLEGYDGEWETITSKFHFVDLAGSERLKRTAASGDRAKEGISINSGLLALGNVISALGDPNKTKHMTHIPYRDSKLTRLLQDSLGGNAQTLMIACVSPAEFNLNETINTLKYANRARNIKNMASVNKEESGWNDVSHLQGLVIKLRAEVSTLKNLLANGHHQSGGGNVSPGRVTPTPTTPTTPNGIKLPGRSNSISSIPGRSTPTSGIPGRSTPTSGIPGRSTPTGIPGRSTPTTGMPGRSMYNNIANNREPVNRMRPGSPLTTFAHGGNVQVHKDKEVEILEEQLMQLQRSYAELSQKYAKTSAELAMHQNNYDELESTTKNEPQIENYEKMISSLESNLAITSAALLHSETLLREQESQMKELEQENELNKNNMKDLQHQIKDLESKLQNQEIVARTRIQNDSYPEKFISETVQLLERRLEEKDTYCAELEEKLERATKDENTKQLREELDDRDFRITQLESKLNLLVEEVYKFRNMEGFRYQSETGPLDSTSASSSSFDTI
ncbi:1853_t:CDS:2, partial [Acaulospora colombiana]